MLERKKMGKYPWTLNFLLDRITSATWSSYRCHNQLGYRTGTISPWYNGTWTNLTWSPRWQSPTSLNVIMLQNSKRRFWFVVVGFFFFSCISHNTESIARQYRFFWFPWLLHRKQKAVISSKSNLESEANSLTMQMLVKGTSNHYCCLTCKAKLKGNGQHN